MRELIIGVDLHKRQASYAVLDREQTVYAEEEIPNENRDKIREFLLRWKQPETTTTLIVEATGSWYWFVDFVKPLVDRVKLADTFWSLGTWRSWKSVAKWRKATRCPRSFERSVMCSGRGCVWFRSARR